MDNPKPEVKGGTSGIQARQPSDLRGFKKDPTRHYVLVEKTTQHNDWFESPIEDFLSKVSPSTGGEMYRVETEDRKHTGNARKVLMSCSQEDWELTQKQYDETSRGVQNTPAVSVNPASGEYEQLELSTKSAFSTKDLQGK
jgi:hypothetical protein